MELSRNDAILIGMELRKVVNTESFSKAVDVLKWQYQDQFFNSGVSESEERERTYMQSRALDDLLATFNSFIRMAENDAEERSREAEEGETYDADKLTTI